MKVGCRNPTSLIYRVFQARSCMDPIPYTGLSQGSYASASGLNVADYRTTLKKKIVTAGYQPPRKSSGIALSRDELRTEMSQFPE